MSMYMNGRYFKITHPPRSFFVEGNPVVFKTKYKLPIKNLKVNFNPVQEGEGDPSPENVRPITGWTGANVEAAGKNLFDKASATLDVYLDASGNEVTSTAFCASDYIAIKSPCYYSGAAGFFGTAPCSCFYDENKTFISSAHWANTSGAITVPDGAKYIRVSLRPEDRDTFQLELGSTATAYEPYQGSTVPISWSSSAGTVYGGYLEWEKDGSVTLTVNRAMITVMPDNVLIVQVEYNNVRCTTDIEEMKLLSSYQDGYVDKLIYKKSWSDVSITPFAFGCNSPNNRQFVVNKSVGTTLEEIRAFVGTDGLHFVTYLKNPVTYTLTPQEALTLLQGTNTIWSDTNGNLEVTCESYTNEQ